MTDIIPKQPMSVQEAFNTAATEYDNLRRTFIPCFNDFYKAAVEVIPCDRTASLKVLDLGAGTGLYSGMVGAMFPNAEFTLMDFATEMLELAKARFEKLGKSPKIVVGDYSKTDIGDAYDLIISACSIHHLCDRDKEHLFYRIYDVLKPGGMFINADQISGKTPKLEEFYQQHWLNEVRALGVSDEHLKAAQHRMTYDRLTPLETQLNWLESTGFQDVDCYYKSFSFAVFGGYRPPQEVQQPTLETPRLILRPFTLDDAPEVQRLASDRDIAAMTLTIPHPYEDGEAQRWIKMHPIDFKKGIGVYFAIVLKENGLLCGAIGLGFDKVNNNAEIGYWIGKPFWGKGYCTEAAKAVLQYGFETLGLHRIHSGHFSQNPASGRVMQKIDMKYEGCRRQYVFKWGKYINLELYGILKSDWKQKNED